MSRVETGSVLERKSGDMKTLRMDLDKPTFEVERIDYLALFGVLRRQAKRAIMMVSLIMFVAVLYAFTRSPVYTAQALLQIEPQAQDILATAAGAQNFGINDIRLDGEIEILRSDAVAQRVVEAADLQTDPEFGGDGVVEKQVIKALQENTEIIRRGQTYLVAVRVSSQMPEKAAALSNILAQAYIDHQIEARIAGLGNVAEVLRTRLLVAERALADSEGLIDAFLLDNSLAIGAGRDDLSGLYDEVQILRGLADSRQTEAAALEGALARQDTQQLAEALDFQGELALIDAELEAQAQARLAGLSREIEGIEADAARATGEVRRLALEGTLPPQILPQLYGLQREAMIVREQYNSFLTRLRDIEMQAQMQMAGARIVSPALVPLAPSSQSRREFLVLAAAFALCVGAGLAFITEYVAGGFTSAGQLAAVSRLKVAAEIPMVQPLAPRPGVEPSAAQVLAVQPMGAYGESIRRLRMALDNVDSRKGRVTMVTSALPGEGKSNTCLALGRVYAASGKRCLLIDCDLRKPRINKLAGLGTGSGLLDYLEGESGVFSEWVVADGGSGLHILPGAGRSHGPTDDLLTGARFGTLLEMARKAYDVVLLDTPPLQPVIDANLLARQSDAIVLAVKWGRTSQRDVRTVLPGLKDAKRPDAPIITVLTQTRSSGFRYSQKYDDYFQN